MAETKEEEKKHGPRPESLKVLSLNVFPGRPTPWLFDNHDLEGSQRLDQIAQLILATEPDVVCLQEMHSYKARNCLEKALPGYIMYHPNRARRNYALAPYLLWAILALPCAYCGYVFLRDLASIIFQGVVGSFLLVWFVLIKSPLGAWLLDDDMGLCTLYKEGLCADEEVERYPFLDEDGDWLSHFAPRGYELLDLYYEDGVVSIANTHLNAYGKDHLRTNQLMDVAKVCRYGQYSILCGDLNCDVGSPAIQWAREQGWLDVINYASTPTWQPGWPDKGPGARRLDYVLVHNAQIEGRVIQNEVSDHKAIFAAITFEKKKS